VACEGGKKANVLVSVVVVYFRLPQVFCVLRRNDEMMIVVDPRLFALSGLLLGGLCKMGAIRCSLCNSLHLSAALEIDRLRMRKIAARMIFLLVASVWKCGIKKAQAKNGGCPF
jgi:hypothetical protein